MISFVYFDVGGVVIKDFSGNNKWLELEQEIGIRDKDSQAFIDFWDANEDQICKGRDTDEVFVIAKNKFGLKVPENYSMLKDGFLKRLEKNETILPTIEAAKKKGKIGLLTNMYPNMLNLIFQKGIMPNSDWDIVIDSSIEGVAKPDQKIFQVAEERAGVKKEEILFVENSKRHVEAAKQFGWQTFLYDSGNPTKASKDLLKIINST